MPNVFYITHPEVIVDPHTPVPRWPLSVPGQLKMAAICQLREMADVKSVWSSTEQKAQDGRALMAALLKVEGGELPGLGENDRSATGYLPEAKFWPVVEKFFAEPDQSAYGWETARDAQARCVGAVDEVLEQAPDGDVAIIGHGGVGTLLMCHLLKAEISRDHAAGGMGWWFAFDRESREVTQGWTQPPDRPVT
ncbi:MAG: histidine phosphatase family protein [Pseudomonadota bacterium]